MACEMPHAQRALYCDGELGPDELARFARHMAQCDECNAAVRQMERNTLAVRQALAVALPAGLARRVQLALQAEEDIGVAPQVFRPVQKRLWPSGTRLAKLAASWLIVALLSAAGAAAYFASAQQDDLISHDVVAAHLRALVQDTPIQVASSDQHTVKPWFAGRADFAPDVKDFSAQGFALIGGRIDYVGDRRVAAVVYRHDKHLIDVFMWPNAAGEQPPSFASRTGYNLAQWTSGGMEARAISDMAVNEMRSFARLLSGR